MGLVRPEGHIAFRAARDTSFQREAGVYRPRHPKRTVLYRVMFHHSDRFLTEYESRFEREYGFIRPIVSDR